MGGFTVTISAGVAELNPGMDLSRVMELADQALLEAKRSGRDKVVSPLAC
jgi:diguanylate cyclase